MKNKELALAFGAALRTTRQQKGLSQDAMAEKANLDRTYPSLLERGLRSPTLYMVLTLSSALDRPPHVLIETTLEFLKAGAR